MAVLRRIARPLLAAPFVAGGLRTLRDPHGAAPAAEAVAVPLARRIGPLTEDPVHLVRINAAVQFGAGALLTLGRFPRFASLALAASLVPTTLAGHAWWKEEDPDRRTLQRLQFAKNLGLIGGLLIAAADTHGKPSLAYRTRTAVSRGNRTVHRGATWAGDRAQRVAATAGRSASDAVHGTGQAVRSVAGSAREALPGG
ncbi:DoxX [Streptomyces sp. ADI96-02]|uniref:DoxX family protein n=1 Tax=Streptomyces sp. ADI96-02 TaxID=1522760 RepID=UPI000F555684|nr:DoxX family membrane protein [Streptomyces sp. ADI96-02]RPK54189.1 DoxX [Streptomyces sp. ADI96-02]